MRAAEIERASQVRLTPLTVVLSGHCDDFRARSNDTPRPLTGRRRRPIACVFAGLVSVLTVSGRDSVARAGSGHEDVRGILITATDFRRTRASVAEAGMRPLTELVPVPVEEHRARTGYE